MTKPQHYLAVSHDELVFMVSGLTAIMATVIAAAERTRDTMATAHEALDHYRAVSVSTPTDVVNGFLAKCAELHNEMHRPEP